jgi:hypothetical protein
LKNLQTGPTSSTSAPSFFNSRLALNFPQPFILKIVGEKIRPALRVFAARKLTIFGARNSKRVLNFPG